ncbi:hypothetical protein PROFUN_15591 [Planoprotostelium fungivorum]|uniref:Uncharacterized protein n=1 Tax=Planoprotostelium fungivorum TaxID=1890364 RepID=A0A2P6MVN4_9EUKA|nr:hypothetical protein PROFUN_15591 [Planoprotostelium fungivorum]
MLLAFDTANPLLSSDASLKICPSPLWTHLIVNFVNYYWSVNACSVLNKEEVPSEYTQRSYFNCLWRLEKRMRKQFAILRITCKLWKDIMDSSTDWLTEQDLSRAVRGRMMHSIRFFLTYTELEPSLAYVDYKRETTKKMKHLRLDGCFGPIPVLKMTRLSQKKLDYYWSIQSRGGEAASGPSKGLLLARPKVDPLAWDNEAIKIAASNGDCELVELFLADPRVDPSAGNNQAIINASYYGHMEIVWMLLADPRVDPSAQDNMTIAIVSGQEASETIKLLLSHPLVGPFKGFSPAIRVAMLRGDNDVVQLLRNHKPQSAQRTQE